MDVSHRWHRQWFEQSRGLMMLVLSVLEDGALLDVVVDIAVHSCPQKLLFDALISCCVT